jgi:hypothetical protein
MSSNCCLHVKCLTCIPWPSQTNKYMKPQPKEIDKRDAKVSYMQWRHEYNLSFSNKTRKTFLWQKTHYTDSQNLIYHSLDLQEAMRLERKTSQHNTLKVTQCIDYSAFTNKQYFNILSVIQPSASKMCLETNQFVYTKWHIFYSWHNDYVGKEFPRESVNLWSQRIKFKQSNENWSNVNKQVHIASSLILRISILCALPHNASKFCTCMEVRRKH